ncbi:MAG: molybdopterin-synthase adenylyltransferase MoeB [Desulfovibrio sp.]|jgi:adenylyltransferase/sulfurtransferase|nr:molybdopterin-synthase adenylyltransferase MoeB [Desulfovibrio sp.]
MGSTNITSAELSKEEIARYSRHLLLPEVGLEGQKKLKKSRVLLVGAGGLGSPLGLYLAAAGVGTIGIIDNDRVEENNLQRQIIHRTCDVGRKKTDSAKDGILRLNPEISVLTFNTTLSSANALEIFSRFDIIVDGSDNFPTRYLINDACALLGKPDVYGAVYRFEGQATVFDARQGCCLRCLMPEPPAPGEVPSCGEGGVLGVLPGIVGGIQATETIKLILGQPASLISRLLAFDAWHMRFHTFHLSKKADCPLCGEHPSVRELIDYERFCGLRPETARTDEDNVESISPKELKRLLDQVADIQLLDVRLPEELFVSKLPGATHMPMNRLCARMDELDPGRDAVVVCKIGERSELAIRMLREEGYRGRLLNLRGGMNAWAEDVAPDLPTY